MTTLNKRQQFINHFTSLWQLEFSDRQKTLSPLLFAATLLFLNAFSFGELFAEQAAVVFVAETFLTLFFVLQLSFMRTFDHELSDDAFTILRTYGLNSEIWFLSKFCFVVVWGSMVMGLTLCMNALLNEKYLGFLLPPVPLLCVAGLALCGLAALGILLAAMMQKTKGNAILYPLIYFPLTSPVLIAAVQASLEILAKKQTLSELLPNWLGLLLIFDVIYITLSTLLFGELLKAD